MQPFDFAPRYKVEPSTHYSRQVRGTRIKRALRRYSAPASLSVAFAVAVYFIAQLARAF